MMFSIILDQSVKTKDNVPVVIDTIVYYKITDRSKFFELSNNPQNIIDNLAIKVLHAIIGNFAANEIQSSIEMICIKMKDALNQKTEFYGIKIYPIDLKRVSFENEDEKERKNK